MELDVQVASEGENLYNNVEPVSMKRTRIKSAAFSSKKVNPLKYEVARYQHTHRRARSACALR